ncbi:nodulation-signaling pathway 1 protein isoform X1 [Tripterygium wilfordii]|uniref:Nodulation-signaling pathway 1 protein isoform X1 n=1 Tax=Tripterygium wilfordii TaxID=458696 RepID=A0A7J7DH35_TRIWF|nr:protein NODULATION SIGNALING PATHWAY 1-like [Tripterygium wilfordii]KAF5745554.1 nodulation-signaling pathway 1 protein isoform X1 [Tripterygium wilfordii]
MTIEEPDPNPSADHVLDWLEDSVSFLSSYLDDPYLGDISTCWWDQSQDAGQDFINTNTAFSSSTNNITTSPPPIVAKHSPPSGSSNKRKASDDQVLKASQNHHQRKSNGRRINKERDGDGVVQEVVAAKKSVGNKKSTGKVIGNNGSNSNNKEGRWAEQLLNPCAAAITAGNLSRVQHLLYVIHELASPTGDANHRLAAHGLRALTHHLSSSSPSVGPTTFASTEPRFFQRSLLKFYEVSPWFSFPNNIANASILQILSGETDQTRNLHILDIGVSHGVQWPTLLEALTRRSGGPPPLVRITVVAATIEADQNTETPFSIGPQGDNFSSRLLAFAKSMDINLQIERLDNYPLHKLDAHIINASSDETLIVCAQFRLHHLNHSTPDERSEFFKALRSLEPKGVILSENNMDCSCTTCGDFATGFSRRVEYLWRFLDSTSSAFKGRESEERRVMEGEAAKAMTNRREMNEGKDKWCERMRGAGFVVEVFGEDAIDGARAMLRKYDSNWEMKVDEKDGCVGLWWKGQPVSFCSLWKSNMKLEDS